MSIQTIFRRPGSEPESKPVYIQWKDGYEERTRETCKRCDLPLFYFNQKGRNPKLSIFVTFLTNVLILIQVDRYSFMKMHLKHLLNMLQINNNQMSH